MVGGPRLFTPPTLVLIDALDQLQRTVPWVGQVERATIKAGAAQYAVGVALLRLLVGVVALLAQRLQVGAVEEQLQVTTVRLDVVHH